MTPTVTPVEEEPEHEQEEVVEADVTDKDIDRLDEEILAGMSHPVYVPPPRKVCPPWVIKKKSK